VICTYAGHPAPEKAQNDESFELEGTTSDDPITSHWNFESLLALYGGSRKPDRNSGRIIWPEKLTPKGSSQAVRNPMFGVEAWAAPGLVWNHNFIAQELDGSIIKTLGTISRDVPGNPPELSGNRSWLCIRVRGSFRGNVWKMQRSWQLSGPGGFVPEMYKVTI
jgi:hypothetical protein